MTLIHIYPLSNTRAVLARQGMEVHVRRYCHRG